MPSEFADKTPQMMQDFKIKATTKQRSDPMQVCTVDGRVDCLARAVPDS